MRRFDSGPSSHSAPRFDDASSTASGVSWEAASYYAWSEGRGDARQSATAPCSDYCWEFAEGFGPAMPKQDAVAAPNTAQELEEEEAELEQLAAMMRAVLNEDGIGKTKEGAEAAVLQKVAAEEQKLSIEPR